MEEWDRTIKDFSSNVMTQKMVKIICPNQCKFSSFIKLSQMEKNNANNIFNEMFNLLILGSEEK